MTYVVAEAGANAVRSFDAGVALIRAAAEAGADAVKFQLFRPEDLYEHGTPQYEAAKAGELPSWWIEDLAGTCEDEFVDFACSAFAPWAVDHVDPFVKWHKVASLEMVEVDLVRHITTKRKPIILSTGAATIEEVTVVRGIIESSWWGAKVCVLQAAAAYPAPVNETDLLAMPTLGSCYGFSNNSPDWDLSVGAAYMGASVIEQHLRLPTTPKDSPDYPHSIEPEQFAAMVQGIRRAEQARGIARKYVRPSEQELRKWQHAPGGLRGGIHA